MREEEINRVCEEAAEYGERLLRERLALAHLGDYRIVVVHDPEKGLITVDVEIVVSRRLGVNVSRLADQVASQVIRYVEEKIKGDEKA